MRQRTIRPPAAPMLHESFTKDVSAPLTSPRVSEPGPGQWTLVQTDGQFSTTGGTLAFPKQAVSTWGDQGGRDVGRARRAGRAFLASIRLDLHGEMVLGLSNTGIYAGTVAQLRECWYWFLLSGSAQFADLQYVSNGSYPSVSIGILAIATWYDLLMVQLSAGALYLIRGGQYPIWTKLLATTTDITATMIAQFSNRQSSGRINDLIMRDLDGVWSSGVAIASKAAQLDRVFGPWKQLHITTAADVTTLRAAAIAQIWSGNGYPATGISSTSTGISDPITSSAANLASVDSYTITMSDGFSATAYCWHPTTDNGNLVLYHNGHSTNMNDVEQGTRINEFINDGYTVIGFLMVGSGSTVTHNGYPAPTGSLNYLKFFLEPVVRVLNDKAGSFSAVFMCGLSGGGWTTVLMAALDTRITRSAPVAGAMPMHLDYPGARDWEQLLPGLVQFLGYEDLFLMACDGNRRQLVVYNTTDPSIFTRADYDVAPFDLSAQAVTIGGTWSVTFDSTHSAHKISSAAGTTIRTFFGAA